MAKNALSNKRGDEEPPHQVEVFFDIRDGSYWFRLNGRYIALRKSDLQLHLRSTFDLSDKIYFDGLRELDWPLWNAQMHRMIDYAGSLAGHRTGNFTDSAKRNFLVTDEAQGVWDDPGKRPPDPAFFSIFIQELLPDDQWKQFCYWLAAALRSLRRGDFRPGQVVVLAGPAQCGKSLLQSMITEILGGRSANPFRYMMGLTQFNKDLAGAEHWQIEDPATTTDIRTRRQFGAMLKECTVNRDFSIHQKGKDALSLPLFRRVTISVNDEPENLAVVPPLEPSIEDKVFLFHCSKVEEAFAPFRVVCGTPSLLAETRYDGELDRAAVWKHVLEQVPLIRAWLLRKFTTVPEGIRDDRFAVRAWHHPHLRAELCALAPETRLLQLIDEVCFDKENPCPWTGKSIDLESELRKSAFAFECEKVLRYFGACGAYLGKLAKSQPERVSKRIKDGYTLWTITSPSQEKETNAQE